MLDQTAISPVPGAENGQRPGPDHRLLLVDDDRFVLMAVARRMRQLGLDMALDHAWNGAEGLDRLLARVRPAAVLLDLYMPRMNGIEMLTRLSHMPGRRSVPVYLMTMSDLPRDLLSGVSHLIDGLILKDRNFEGMDEALTRHGGLVEAAAHRH